MIGNYDSNEIENYSEEFNCNVNILINMNSQIQYFYHLTFRWYVTSVMKVDGAVTVKSVTMPLNWMSCVPTGSGSNIIQ